MEGLLAGRIATLAMLTANVAEWRYLAILEPELVTHAGHSKKKLKCLR